MLLLFVLATVMIGANLRIPGEANEFAAEDEIER